MPELPEVESIVRGLNPSVVGRTFTAVWVGWPRSVPTGARQLQRALPGLRIAALGRRGKHLQFDLVDANGMEAGALLVHLRMSGRLELVPPGTSVGPHTRVAFGLDDGERLLFDDTRKFGRVWLTADAEEVTGQLGPEPLDAEGAFAAQVSLAPRRPNVFHVADYGVVGLWEEVGPSFCNAVAELRR